MNMSNKKHLKHLFSCHADIEKRIDKLKEIDTGLGCDVCNRSTLELVEAEIKGLQQGEKLIDAIINYYLADHC